MIAPALRRTALAVLWWTAGSWALAQNPEVVRRELGQGLKTIQVVSVRADEKEVKYLPVRASIVDEDGRPAKPAVQSIGDGRELVSGYLTLTADADEVTELTRRSRKALGDKVKVVPVRAETFACWLKAGDSVAWRRPVADGPLTPMSFQAALPATKEKTLVSVVTWSERRPGIAAKFSIDWDEVKTGLNKAAGVNGRLTEAKLLELAGTAVTAKWVKVGAGGDAADRERLLDLVRSTFLDELKGRILEIDEPQLDAPKRDQEKSPSGLVISYRLRTDVRRTAGTETIDLNVARDVRRTTLLTGPVVIEK